MKASILEKVLRKHNEGKAIYQYLIVKDVCTNECTKFYAINDEAAYEFACKNWDKGLRVYKYIGGGIFLGETK